MPRMERYAKGIPCWVDLQTTDEGGRGVPQGGHFSLMAPPEAP